MYRVSVVMPVYNNENTIEASITSILNQSLYGLELILINDGSTDSSGSICNFYREQEPLLIRVIHQKRSGFAVARNKGLEMAGGKYIYFANANNVFNHRLLQNSLNLAEETNSNLVVFGFKEQVFTNKHTEIIQHLPPLPLITTQNQFRNHYRNFHQFFPYILANKLYNHEYLVSKQIKFQRIPYKEVEFFNLSVYEQLNSAAFSREVLCYKKIEYINEKPLLLSNHFILSIELAKKLEQMITLWKKEKDYEDIIAKEFFNIIYEETLKITNSEYSVHEQKRRIKQMLENNDVKIFFKCYQSIKKKTPYERALCSYMRKGNIKRIIQLASTKKQINQQAKRVKNFVQNIFNN